jgi:hypothetical protein
MKYIEIKTATALKTFSCGSTCRMFSVLDGVVKAFDDVAGHYTVCHSLTTRQQSYLRRLAAKQAA